VEWTVSGDVGTVDENGLLTVSENGGSGEITASAGGQSYTFSLSTRNVHRDVTEEHWAYAAVSYCYDKGIVGGVSATQFGRDHTIRRADFMLMLYNAVGRPAPAAGCSFTDVNEADYYYTALSWAQEAGLASGTGDGAYSPSANITREQAFTILRKAMPLLGKECPDAGLIVLDAFGDKDLIADYARGFAATLVAQGVVSGKGDNLDPRGSLTRAEMAALLYKIITYTPVPDVPQDPIPEEPAPPAPDLPEEPAPEVPAPLTGTVTNAELSLNVRSGPGTSHTVIGRLENGAQVTVLERLEGWYRILFPAQDDPAAEGYVSADYLTLSN